MVSNIKGNWNVILSVPTWTAIQLLLRLYSLSSPPSLVTQGHLFVASNADGGDGGDDGGFGGGGGGGGEGGSSIGSFLGILAIAAVSASVCLRIYTIDSRKQKR